MGMDSSSPAGGAKFSELASHPMLRDMLAANGGFGLDAFVSSMGLMEHGPRLEDLCRQLAQLTGEHPLRNTAYVPGPGSAHRRGAAEHSPGGANQGNPAGRGISEAAPPTPEAATHGVAAPHPRADTDMDIGALCRRFESGRMGVGAIGHDRTGGTSYGLYQIASNTGSMDRFLDFLDTRDPNLSRRLRAAGPANTGSRDGDMPDEWRHIAREQPRRFGELQRDFIRASHYEPAARKTLEASGLNVAERSEALQEVLWSTAVQHGATGASRIFARAVERAGDPTAPGFESRLIENVYAIRGGQFGSSTQRVQAAVQNRFQREQQLAMLMLNSKSSMA